MISTLPILKTTTLKALTLKALTLKATYPEGSDSEGSDSEGSDSEGSDSEGSDSEGSDSEGSDSEGSDSEGSDSGDDIRRPVAVIGAGAVGGSLARRLAVRQVPVRAVLSSRRASARELAADVGAAVASDDVRDLPSDVRRVFLCVPDDALPGVAAELAEVDHPWSDTIVAHTSGARPAGDLQALDRVGASLLSFHPVQSFATPNASAAFDGIYIGVEGHEVGIRYGSALARRLGATPFPLTAESKTRVHCAAALASNGFTALLAVVQEVLGTAGLDAADATSVVQPLVDQTWENLRSNPPDDALTGPVVRGDRETVGSHVHTLRNGLSHLLPIYVALVTEQVRVAVRGGRLRPETAAAILDEVESALYIDVQPPPSSQSDAPGDGGPHVTNP